MKKLIFAVAMLLCTSVAFAQFQFSVHAGGSFPRGSFGSTDIANFYNDCGWFSEDGQNAYASIGANLGVKAKYNLPVQGLGAIATVDVFFNGLNKDARKYLDNQIYGVGRGNNYSGETWTEYVENNSTPKFFNVPVMLGLNYQYDIDDMLGIWAEAALGMNFQKITNYSRRLWNFYDGYYNEDGTYKYDINSSFCYQFGLGVSFSNKLSLGIHYYHLGTTECKVSFEKEFDYSYEGYGSGSDNISGSETLGKLVDNAMLVVRLGYHF